MKSNRRVLGEIPVPPVMERKKAPQGASLPSAPFCIAPEGKAMRQEDHVWQIDTVARSRICVFL